MIVLASISEIGTSHSKRGFDSIGHGDALEASFEKNNTLSGSGPTPSTNLNTSRDFDSLVVFSYAPSCSASALQTARRQRQMMEWEVREGEAGLLEHLDVARKREACKERQ